MIGNYFMAIGYNTDENDNPVLNKTVRDIKNALESTCLCAEFDHYEDSYWLDMVRGVSKHGDRWEVLFTSGTTFYALSEDDFPKLSQ